MKEDVTISETLLMSKSLFEMDIMRNIMRGRTERITHCQMLEDFFLFLNILDASNRRWLNPPMTSPRLAKKDRTDGGKKPS